mmetsp:Transcript_27973/g.66460  ORF Transcript_27973/g.66460 Transcript_27973/m.66460 type:complete len:230 (+) Transcript_27973:2198-2887(+)
MFPKRRLHSRRRRCRDAAAERAVSRQPRTFGTRGCEGTDERLPRPCRRPPPRWCRAVPPAEGEGLAPAVVQCCGVGPFEAAAAGTRSLQRAGRRTRNILGEEAAAARDGPGSPHCCGRRGADILCKQGGTATALGARGISLNHTWQWPPELFREQGSAGAGKGLGGPVCRSRQQPPIVSCGQAAVKPALGNAASGRGPDSLPCCGRRLHPVPCGKQAAAADTALGDVNQ